MKLLFLIITFSCLFSQRHYSQDRDSLYEHSIFNITFLPNYLTGDRNWQRSFRINTFSLNILAGNGDIVHGIELGGLWNGVTSEAKGIQVAGLVNTVDWDFEGIQAAGIVNLVDGEFRPLNIFGVNTIGIQMAGISNVINEFDAGIQLAGVANITNNFDGGIQISGIGNIVDGTFNGGIQISGISNVNDRNFNGGIQISGISNVVDDEFNGGIQLGGVANIVGNGYNGGIQFAGISNIVDENFNSGVQIGGIANVIGYTFNNGIQIGGLANVVDRNFTDGIQITGLANVVDDQFSNGIQLAGLVNVTDNFNNGIQIAGLVNVTNDFVNGIQIGLINVAEYHDGYPIGLMSFVADEDIQFDMWADEGKFINFGLRTGSRHFRNTLFIGSNQATIGLGDTDANRLTIGLILSRHIELGRVSFLDIDLSAQQIMVEDQIWDENQLYKFRLIFGKRFLNDISIFIGPTLNYYRSVVDNGENLAAWTFNESKTSNLWERSWLGVIAGLRF